MTYRTARLPGSAKWRARERRPQSPSCGRLNFQCQPLPRLTVEAAWRISLLACFQACLPLAALPIRASKFTSRALLSGAPGASNSHVGFPGVVPACVAKVAGTRCEPWTPDAPAAVGPEVLVHMAFCFWLVDPCLRTSAAMACRVMR